MRFLTLCLSLCICLLAPAPAQAEWHEAQSRHFTIYSEGDPDRLREFAIRLERFDATVRLLNGLPDPATSRSRRVTVFMLNSLGDVRALSRINNVAGFYIPRARGSIAFVPRYSSDPRSSQDANSIIQHEYAHHLMWTSYSNAAFPAWLVEGFAEFYATTEFARDGSIIVGTPPQYRARAILQGNPLPIQQMLGKLPAQMSEAQRQALYGRGWLLTHYVTFNRERGAQYAAYLKALNEGRAPEQASAAFGDLDALQSDLNRYAQTRFAAITLRGDAIPTPEVRLRALGAGESAMMDIRINAERGVPRDQTSALAERARRVASAHPTDPGAQLVLAEAEFVAANYEQADAAAVRVLASDPRSTRALIYRGLAQMRAATRDKKTDTATWQAIRQYFLQANKIDTEDSQPLALYYQSFAAARERPTENAKQAIVYAQQLAPHDAGLRMNAGVVLLRDGKVAEARRLLAPVAFSPHRNTMAERALKLVEAIDIRQGRVPDAGTLDAADPNPTGPEPSDPDA